MQIAVVNAETGETTLRDMTPDEEAACQADWDAAAARDAANTAPTVPQTVSNLQGRMALVGAGIFTSVDAAIEALDHASPAYLAWHYATVFQRNSPLMQSIASSLSIPDDQIDALFVAAAQINI